MKIFKLELPMPLDLGDDPHEFFRSHGILIERDSGLTSLTRESLESFCVDFYYNDGEADSLEVHELLGEIRELEFKCPAAGEVSRHFWSGPLSEDNCDAPPVAADDLQRAAGRAAESLLEEL